MNYGHDERGAFSGDRPRFIKPRLVNGPRLRFRNAVPDDAEFILSLRLDEQKNAHISATSSDIEAQRSWLRSMRDDQLYFIIETEHPVGTVRLYDQKGLSFSWGSWILSNDAPKSSAVESTLMVYATGLKLGFSAAHFDVRKGNEKVWKYHERLGANRIGETEIDYYYSMPKEAMLQAFETYKERLKPPIKIEW